MEYKTHKPVPVFELDAIIQKFQKMNQEKSAASKKGSAFNL